MEVEVGMQFGFLDPLASTSARLFHSLSYLQPKPPKVCCWEYSSQHLPNIILNVMRNTRTHPEANPTISTLGSNLLREGGGWPQTLGLRRFWKSQCAIGSSARAGGEFIQQRLPT